MDAEIYEAVRRIFNCRAKKVGAFQRTVTVERKERVRVKRRVLGIFPIYEYGRWTEIIRNWNYMTLTFTHRISRRESKFDIAVCYDEVGKVAYWRYA